MDNEECALNMACINNQCQNPCHMNNPCTNQHDCQVQNHQPVCVKGDCLIFCIMSGITCYRGVCWEVYFTHSCSFSEVCSKYRKSLEDLNNLFSQVEKNTDHLSNFKLSVYCKGRNDSEALLYLSVKVVHTAHECHKNRILYSTTSTCK